jgi:hypothetical protein
MTSTDQPNHTAYQTHPIGAAPVDLDATAPALAASIFHELNDAPAPQEANPPRLNVPSQPIPFPVQNEQQAEQQRETAFGTLLYWDQKPARLSVARRSRYYQLRALLGFPPLPTILAAGAAGDPGAFLGDAQLLIFVTTVPTNELLPVLGESQEAFVYHYENWLENNIPDQKAAQAMALANAIMTAANAGQAIPEEAGAGK